MIYSLFHWRFYFNHWSFSVYFKTDLEDLWFSHTYRCMPSLEISVAGCIRWVSFRINGRKLKYDIHQWTFFSRRMSDGLRSSFWAHVHIILQCYKRIPGIFFFTVNDVIIYRKKICNLTIDNDLHLNSQPWINIQERYQFFTVEVLPRVLNVPCVVQKQGLSLKEENVYLNARQLF